MKVMQYGACMFRTSMFSINNDQIIQFKIIEYLKKTETFLLILPHGSLIQNFHMKDFL